MIPRPESVPTAERIAEMVEEYAGYNPGIKFGRVYGTCTVGEFQALLARAQPAAEAPRDDREPVSDAEILLQELIENLEEALTRLVVLLGAHEILDKKGFRMAMGYLRKACAIVGMDGDPHPQVREAMKLLAALSHPTPEDK